MASLSNINGLFDVHSTGAILFSTSHGTSGQILKSNGNAAPTWVAASTVIGGPYLPLTGGTLTGATATATGISFTVGGNLFVTGNSTLTGALSVGGALTGTSATFSGNVTVGNNAIQNGTNPGLKVTSTNTSQTVLSIDSTTTRNYELAVGGTASGIGSGSFYIYDGTAAAARLVINSSGVKVQGSASDQFFLQGFRTGNSGNTFSIYDNNSTAYINSYQTMFFRANQHGGSGGNFIFTGGKVGMGTTSPHSQLQVGDSAQTTSAVITIASRYGGSNPYLNFRSGHPSNSNVWNMASIHGDDDGNYNGKLEFRTATSGQADPTIKMIIKATGKVGIGSTSPQTKLDVASTVLIDQDGTYGGGYGMVGFGGTTNGYNRVFGNTGTGDGLFLASATGKGIYFRPNGSSTDSVSINASGNLGIGTSSAGEKLQVNSGNIKIDGLATSSVRGLIIAHTGQTGNQTLLVQNSSSSIGHLYTTERALRIEAGQGGSASGGTLDFWVNQAERMTIDTSGNVGIGTTAPGAKLEITDGNLWLNGVTSNYNPEIFFIDDAGPTGIAGAKIRYENNNGNLYFDHKWDTATSGFFFRNRVDGTTLNTMSLVNGKVGIGTTSPSAQLHNYSTAASNVFITGYGTSAQNDWGAQNAMFVKTDNGLLISKENAANNTNRIFNFYNDSSGHAQLYMHAGAATATIKLDSSGNSYFNGGNVGIGTTSPTLGKLQVAGRGYFGPVGTGDATTKAEVISNAVLRLKPHDNNSTSLSFASMNGGDTVGLQTTNGPGTANWNVALSPFGGRVGIGTSGPSALLDIGGGDGTPAGTQFQAVIKSTGSRTLYLDGGDSSTASMWWGKGNTPHFALDSISGGGVQFWTYTGGWNQRMTLLSGGNLGIGSTSPGYKLDIKNTSSEDSNMALRNSGSGHAGIYFDGSNGDLVGSDYAWIGQRNSTLKFEISTSVSAGSIHLIPQNGSGVVEVSGKVVANNHGEFAGALRVTETGTAQHILIGNQDSGGANKPAMIQGVNGSLKFGYGNSWTGEGGTMTDILVLDASNFATFANRVTLGPGTTGAPYDVTTFLHVKGTSRSIVQQSSTADAYYMFGDAGANNAAWVGYNHSSGNLDLHAQTSVSIDKNTSITGNLTVSGTLTAQEIRTELTTTTILYDSGSTKFGDTSDDNHDFTGSLNVQGNVEHTGLTMTSGTDIDQLYSTTKSMTLNTNWQDTGINGTDLATGTYVVSVYAHDNAVGGGHWSETYSGTMTWWSGDTNSNDTDEILLHKAGHASSSKNIYLRTIRTYTADTDDLKLQIAHSATCTGNSNYVFKFRRLI